MPLTLFFVMISSVSCFSSIVPLTHHHHRHYHDTFFQIRAFKRRNSSDSRQTEKSSQEAWYVDSELSRSIRPSISASIPSLEEEEEEVPKRGTFSDDDLFIVTIPASRPGGSVRHCMSYEYSSKEGEHQEKEERVDVVIFTTQEIETLVGKELLEQLVRGTCSNPHESNEMLLVWVGERQNHQHWALMLPPTFLPQNNRVKPPPQHQNKPTSESALLQAIGKTKSTITQNHRLEFLPLREFGDSILDPHQAAIHATSNALLEFHVSHLYCSACGSPTQPQNLASSRGCTNHINLGGTCVARSIYPRIDIASIMLITSPCGKYALLGRKSFWPKGRYSTLAGFMEVGETLEECCRRETFEEAGVVVDPESVEFVESAPWPFPRSLMVGFRGRAMIDNVGGEESGDTHTPCLPVIDFDEEEMEDVQWFSKDYVGKHLEGGSTALLYEPTDGEKEFHIPGKASLARRLITAWAEED